LQASAVKLLGTALFWAIRQREVVLAQKNAVLFFPTVHISSPYLLHVRTRHLAQNLPIPEDERSQPRNFQRRKFSVYLPVIYLSVSYYICI
jgi:hypothetical protein